MRKSSRRIVYFSKWRALFKITMFLVIISAYLPSSFLETNVEEFEDMVSKDFATSAIKLTSDTFKNTVDQLLIVSYAIESFNEDNGKLTSSVVTAYTVFGIPYAEVIAYEDEAFVNRKFFFND